jgi:prepilin-type processing-associated H-X9-DG protein
MRAKSLVNLSAIGKYLALYESETGRPAPSLKKLAESYKMPKEMLVCPLSGREPRTDAAGKPAGPFDYVYIATGVKTGEIRSPADRIVVHEDPALAVDGKIGVLYADGHVEAVPLERFRKQLARTPQALRSR